MPRQLLRAIVPAAGYYSEAGDPASLETEVLFGECVELLGKSKTHFRVQSEYYSTPGFVLKKHLVSYDHEQHTATHRVLVPEANVYYHPNFKSGVCMTLPFNARLTATGNRERTAEGVMLEFKDCGWAFEDTLHSFDKLLRDYVELARSRIQRTGAYVWGSRAKPDCSAFVMDSLLPCGIPCPRNVGEQAQQLGTPVIFDQGLANLKKGDFVFWTDPATTGRHVVMMVSPARCVHSTIAYRGIVEQQLYEAIRDQEAGGNGRPTAVRRIRNHY